MWLWNVHACSSSVGVFEQLAFCPEGGGAAHLSSAVYHACAMSRQ